MCLTVQEVSFREGVGREFETSLDTRHDLPRSSKPSHKAGMSEQDIKGRCHTLHEHGSESLLRDI